MKHHDPIHRRRLVLHGVLQTIAEQLPLEGVDPALHREAWKTFFANALWPDISSEEVLRRDDWHETILTIESWAAQQGVEFQQREAA